MARTSVDRRSGGRQPATGPTRREHAREWLLLTGDRLLVSALLLAVVAAAAVAAVASGAVPLVGTQPVLFVLFALVSGNFTLVTIVVSLNQFVLTRHLESPDEIRRRMDEMLGYRREVGEASARTVLPITPSGFLEVLFHTLAREGRDLAREAPEVDDETAQAAMQHLADELAGHTTYVIDLLEDTPSGAQPALFTTLNASYAAYIHLAFYLESEHAGALTDEAASLLGDVVRSLEQIDVARRSFKTVFIQSELASLSRRLLYIGLPVQILTVLLMLSFSTPAGDGPPRAVLSVVIPTVVVLGFAPFVILTAYILRLSTVAQRTAAMYPFTDEPAAVGDSFGTDGGSSADGDGEKRDGR